MKSIANVWIRMKMIYLLIKSNIKTLIDLVDMSIYIISGNQLNNLVKIGMTFDPVSRIRNMQTYHPEPVRYIRIYTLTFSNNITLRDLEKALLSYSNRINIPARIFTMMKNVLWNFILMKLSIF